MSMPVSQRVDALVRSPRGDGTARRGDLGVERRGSAPARTLVPVLVVAALLAAACADRPEPTLTTERPETPPAASPAPREDMATAQTPEVTTPLDTTPERPDLGTARDPEPPAPPEPLPAPPEDPDPPAPPPAPAPAPPPPPAPAPPEVAGSSERSESATEPDVPSEDLGPAPLPAPPPPRRAAQTPSPTAPPAPGDQVTVLISKDDVNGIIPVYDSPDGTRLSFPDGELWSYTFRGNRLVVRVTQGSPGDEWVEAQLPVRPSGVRGWVRTENFNWSTVNHHILIDVSDRSVTLFEGTQPIISTRAIVGTSNTPTPTLSGFIVEKLPNHSRQNASAVLGDWILMLSFFSEALDTFGGGLPRIALHGTHIPERVGEALSNGCIRIPNNIIEVIARTAPLGTVVNITA